MKIVNVVCQQKVPSKEGGKICGMELIDRLSYFNVDQLVNAIKEHDAVYHNTNYKVVTKR